MSVPAGMFAWNELGTTDTEAAKKFYSALFGWKTSDSPMPGEMGGVYTMVHLGDAEIAGMYKLEGPMEGVPSHWMSYVSTEDCDATARKAVQLGGKITVEPMDVPGVGRMAFLADPTGASISLFQAGGHQGESQVSPRPGAFCWRELLTDNVDVAGRFYTELFGWKAEVQQMSQPYTIFSVGDVQVGGMMARTPEMGPVPNCWTPFVQVDDCDASHWKAQEMGAKVLVPPMDIPVGRFSLLMDPTGATIYLFQTKG